MTPGGRSQVADLILEHLAKLIEDIGDQRAFRRRVESKLEGIDETLDALDRVNRPFGDGTRIPRRNRRGS